MPVGGTICSFAGKDLVRDQDVAKATTLIESGFRASGSRFSSPDETEFAAGARFDTLSENMTFAVWNAVKAYLDGRPYDGCDGVILLHGTDTLGYTAAMFALLYSGIDVPIVFVSANAPLDDAASNGGVNFRAAVECVCRGIAPGVYAVYRNSDGKMRLYEGSRLSQCANYGSDLEGGVVLTDAGDIPISARRGGAGKYDFCGRPLKRCVLKIEPYVGMDYRALDPTRSKAVLHGAYHSGTVCTSAADEGGSAAAFVDRCNECGVDPYIFPAREKGEIYSSQLALAGRVRFLYGMTAEAAYAKLTIAYSYFDDPRQREKFLKEDVAGEYVFRRDE